MCSLVRTREEFMDPANGGRGLFCTVECAAEMMGMSPAGVRKMCRDKRLKSVLCGKSWRISRDYLMGFLGLGAE